MRKVNKITKRIVALALAVVMCMGANLTAHASLTQTETTKDLAAGAGTLTAYAAFDRLGTWVSNGTEWNYQGKASIKNAPSAGTLTLKIKGQATMNTSASMSLGVVDVSASSSSSWQTISDSYSYSKSIKKSTGTQSLSDVSNMVIAPRAHYQTNTACITVTAQVKYTNSSKVYKINALA